MRTTRNTAGARQGERAPSWKQPLARLVGVTVAAVGIIAGPSVITTPVEAASAGVTIRPIASKVVPAGTWTTVKPSFTRRSGVSVRSATMDVRRASSWMGRGVKTARLGAGTYRVTTKVTYRDKGKKAFRTAKRVQSLTVSTASAPSSTPTTPAPSAAEVASGSLAATGMPCDSSSLRKPDGSAWVCTFSDDFSGSSLDRTKWTPTETEHGGYQIGADCFVDDPSTVSVGGGSLSLTVRKTDAPFTCKGAASDAKVQHLAGGVSSWGTFAQARGRFEFRAAFPATKGAGHHSALWLFPKNPTSYFPYSGEIDVAEMYSQYNDRVIPYIHYLDHYDSTVTNYACLMADVSQFHTYTLEWTPTTISIAYDGTPCVVHTLKDPAKGQTMPFDDEFLLVLTQGLGAGSNAVTSSTPAVGTTKVDYVRVWK